MLTATVAEFYEIEQDEDDRRRPAAREDITEQVIYLERRELTLAVSWFAHQHGMHPDHVRRDPSLLRAAIRQHFQLQQAEDRRPLPGISFENLVDMAQDN